MIPIKVEIGLNINNKIEYIPLGIFNIDSVKKDDFTIKITAYDNMSKFKAAYFSSLGNTATLTQVANEIATKTGVQFEGILPAYTVKKLEGFSCREVLSFIASLCGGNAIINRNGKFTIVYPTDINQDIGEGIFGFTREEVKYKIGKITCKAEDKTLSKGSLGADSMEMQFENPWVNESILTDIYNRLNGYEYLGYNLKWQGDLSLDVGDIITYKDDKGVIRKLPIFNRKLSYYGGLDSELSAKGETKNKNSFGSSGSMKKKIDRVVTELAIVNEALIDVAYIGDLTAGNIKFDTASGNIMDLQTLLAKFVTGENGQFLNLTTDNVTISNALIKDVIAKNISVEDLKAGKISTNKFRITSDNGGIEIVGATQQFKDKNNRVRIQMGQDTQGNFNFILRGEDGTTTLIDHTGIKEKAIADNLIKEKMIAENAVGEKQINYSSLVTGLNKDTNTSLIQASKVAIDLTGQRLEVSFNSLKSNVDNMDIGGRNYINQGKGDKKEGFFKSFDKVEGGYGEHTLTSQRTYASVSIKSGFILGCRDYEVGRKVTISYDFMYTKWDFPTGSNRAEFWMGQRYGASTSESSDGAWRGVTQHSLPVIGENGCELNKWIHIERTMIIPKPAHSSILEYASIQFYNSNANISATITFRIKNVKIEYGDKATDWTSAPEDIEEKIESNTTAINIAQGKIEGLIKESSITKGDVTTLKDKYTSIKATVDGINSTVVSHTTSITNLGTNVTNAQNTANKANSLADSKAKVFTTTPTTPYKIGDLWVQGTSGDVMRCKVARASGNYVASDWEKASKYTDDTKANSVEKNLNTLGGKVTTVETKQASLEQNLNGFKTTVSNTYTTKTEYNTLNGTVTNIQQRVNTVEQKVTAEAITTTISSAINAGTSSISTTQFVMDKNGLTIKNGALTIKNKANTNVLTSDTNGNLTITGTFINKNNNGVKAIEINNTNIYFYDWERNGRELGIIYSSYLLDYPNCRGFSLAHNSQGYLTLGYRKPDSSFGAYAIFDKYAKNPAYNAPIRFVESTVFSQAVNMQNRVYVPNTIYLGANAGTTVPMIFGTNNRLVMQVSVSNKDDGLKIQTNTGGILAQILAGYSYPILLNNNTQVSGNLSVTGSKNSLQLTDNYGERLINAIESAEYYYSDFGFGKINNDGECYISIDDILQECVNLDCEYHIFTQKYNGDITSINRHRDYFIVYGEPETKFSWQYIAKRIGYENVRLDVPDIGTIEDIPVFTDEDLKVKTVEDTLLDVLTFKLEDILMEG